MTLIEWGVRADTAEYFKIHIIDKYVAYPADQREPDQHMRLALYNGEGQKYLYTRLPGQP